MRIGPRRRSVGGSAVVLAASLGVALPMIACAPASAQPSSVSGATPVAAAGEKPVTNADELVKALEAAKPGDVIKLAPGKYDGDFVISASGTQDKPITLTGPRTAVLTNPKGKGKSTKIAGPTETESDSASQDKGAGDSKKKNKEDCEDKKDGKKDDDGGKGDGDSKDERSGEDDNDGKDESGGKDDSESVSDAACGRTNDGAAAKASGYGLHLNGASYWNLVGFAVGGGAKGIVLDKSNHVTLDDLEVSQIDQEAIHFRASSSDNVVKNSTVHDTGLQKPQFGEAVYVGSSKNNFGSVGGEDHSNNNQVLDNTLGPNVTAEHIDIKEATTGGLVSGNKFDGHGISGENFADSWVDVKGNGWRIEKNTGTFDGTGKLLDGYQTHKLMDGFGCGNTFADNKSDLGSAAGYAFNLTNQKDCAGKPNVIGPGNTVKGGAGLTNPGSGGEN